MQNFLFFFAFIGKILPVHKCKKINKYNNFSLDLSIITSLTVIIER